MKGQILVVDDEESIRFTFKELLTDEGYVVTTSADFEDAVARISEGEFDVIFADILLGAKTGIDFLKEIKSRGLIAPVIMVTGAPDLETASEAVRSGAFDYIPKPLRQETLSRVCRRALDHKILIEERERYRVNLDAIFNGVQDGILLVGNTLNILQMNNALERICGYSAAESLDRDFNEIELRCGGRCREGLRQAVDKGEPVEIMDMECGRQEKDDHIVIVRATPLRNAAGMASGGIMVIRDVTRMAQLERRLGEQKGTHGIVGNSESMKQVFSLIELLSEVDSTVLITGESGTGKELVAEAIHNASQRLKGPLVKVNCAAIPEALLESELFGHVRGAFTGAIKDKIGRFQKADGGTIFLDEIGDMSAQMQLKLLRILQEMEFERVGDATPIKIDVRVLAATHRDLSKMRKEGTFREDLYYRLKVVEVRMPPLRERLDDLELLTTHFLKHYNGIFRKKIRTVSRDAMDVMLAYDWPGNVRELRHAIEHAFVLCRGDVITIEVLPSEIRGSEGKGPAGEATLDYLDRDSIMAALEKSGGNRARAARLLGTSRSTLYRRIKELDIR